MNNQQRAVRWFEELWNRKNPGVISELMDASAIAVTEGGELRGPDQFRASGYEPLANAFPDLQVEIEGVIGERDEVALRWTVVGTHSGPLLHLAASGRRVTFSGITWLTFKEGKVVRGSDSFNLHGLLAYLAGGPATASVREVKS